MKTKMTQWNIGVGPRLEKPKKADYAQALGRAEAIRHLEAEFSGALQTAPEPLIDS
jgi:hypothetical protein